MTTPREFGQGLAELLVPRTILDQPDAVDAPLRLRQNAQGMLYTNRPLTEDELTALSMALFGDDS